MMKRARRYIGLILSLSSLESPMETLSSLTLGRGAPTLGGPAGKPERGREAGARPPGCLPSPEVRPQQSWDAGRPRL